MSKTALIFIFVVIFITSVVYIKESREDLAKNSLKEGSVILAFGDSLTYGFGVSPVFSYPSFLEKKSGFKVINAGIPGEESSEGLLRIKKFLEQKPDLVILCHGGNDILRKRSASDLKSNLLSMIDLIHESGAKVLLVGVPDFSVLAFDVHPVYDEVANESGVMYEDEVLSYIELHRAYKSDYVHPNEKGYELMADTFIEILSISPL